MSKGRPLTRAQAQPKKSKLDEDQQAKYQHKFLLKAEIITSAANKLWGMQRHKGASTAANGLKNDNSRSKSRRTFKHL